MSRNSTPYSMLKVFYHQDIIQHLLNGERCQPVYIRIKPTNRCNHNCYYCLYKHAYMELDEFNIADEIPREKMLEIVSDMRYMGVKAVTFSGGGEPLLYPHIEETMRAVLDAGIDLSMITNGSLLSGAKAELLAQAKWVRISVESANDDEYCRIRGIKSDSFTKLCDNIKYFAAIKANNCELGINVVVSNDNYKDVYNIATMMKSLGANHVKFSPLVTTDTTEQHSDFREAVTETLRLAHEELDSERFRIIDLYTADFNDSVFFERRYNNCAMKEFICVIGANSKVYYCQNLAYLSKGCIGDINTESFKALWDSDATTDKFRVFNAQKTCCDLHCIHDSRNELLNDFLSMDRNHVNFI